MLLVLALSLARLPAPCPAGVGEERVNLGAGTQKVLRIPGLRGTSTEKVGEAGAEVAVLKILGDDMLLIIGASQGRTKVVAYGTAGRHEITVAVTQNDGICGIFEIAKFFPCDSRISWRMVGDRIFLEGTAESLEEWKSVREALVFKNVVSSVKLAAHFVDRAEHDANQALLKAGFPRTRILVAGTRALLEGDVPAGNEAQVRAVAAPWMAWIESLLSSEGPEPTWAPAEVEPSESTRGNVAAQTGASALPAAPK